MADSQVSSVAHYRTLRRQSAALEQLIGQITRYQPRLTKRDERRRESARRRMYRLNPQQPKDAIDRIVESLFDPVIQWHKRFGQRLSDTWLTIILVSAAVIEESINSYVALKCAAAQKEDLFEDFEKMDLLKKWLLLPSLFVSTYSFPKSGSLYQDLKQLNQCRNALAHPKVTVMKNGKLVLKGTGSKRNAYERDIKFLRACCTLPDRLLQHMLANDQSEEMHIWAMANGSSYP